MSTPKPQANRLDDKSVTMILDDGNETQVIDVETVQALTTEARIDEWDLLGETLHSAGIASELHINNARESRLETLKEKL